MAKERKVSASDAGMKEATGSFPVSDGTNPGKGRMAGISFEFEGLGRLDQFETRVDQRDEEGSGEKCVVLSHLLTANGEAYLRGDIQRISKLVPGNNKDHPLPESEYKEYLKSDIKRLFEQGAIRLAGPEEQEFSHIDIIDANETEAFHAERAKRHELERENEDLRRRLALLQGDTPNEAPVITNTNPVVPPAGMDGEFQ